MEAESSLGIVEQIKFKFPVFSFALLQSKYKRYNWGLAFAMFIPVVQYWALLFFTNEDFSGGNFWVWYYRIYFRVVLFFLVSLVALLIGTGMFRDLISDETIVYVVTKPIRRERIYFEAFAAYTVISIVIVTPGLLVYHIVGDILARTYDATFTITIAQSLFNMLLELGGAYIVLLGLGAVFVTTGLGLKRPLLINLLIAFGIIVQQFLIDLIADNFEPIYIADNIVAKGVVGFASNTMVDQAIYRFSLGIGYEPINTFLNFITILILTLVAGYFVSRRKQFE